MLVSLLTFLVTASLPPEQLRVLVDRYNAVQAAINEQDYTRAAAGLSALVRDYGSSEFGDELRYALAETYFNLGQYNRSLNLFREIALRPRESYIRPEALYGLALSSVMLGDYRQARATLDSLAKTHGYENEPRTNFAQGVLYYFEKDYVQAINKLTGLTMPEAKFYLGKCYAATGKPLPALLNFKEITTEVPNTTLATMAHFAAGEALFMNHDYDGARAKFQFFIENFPYSPLIDYAHYFLGCALIAQREYPAAIGRLTPLTRHSNNFLAAHANYFIGYAYTAMKKSAEAVERFQKVRANYPNTKIAGFANLQLTQAMLGTGDTTQTLLATSQLATMFKTGEISGVGNYLSGVIYYQLGKFDKAEKQFELVLSEYAQTSLREPACAMLLLTLNTAGRFEKCIAVGAKYTTDYPNDRSEWRAKTLYSLAEGFYYYQKYAEADAFYQQAYNLQASSDITPYARLGRCYCLFHLDRLIEAVGGFKSLLTARTDDTLFTICAYLGYGYSLFNQKEYLKALDVFEALTNTFPDQPLAAVPGYFYAGYCYYQLGYYGQAVDAWTTLMNRFPEGNVKVAEAAFRAGDTYFKALEYEKAVAAFRFVVERHPGSPYAPPSQALIAQSFYNRRQFLDAVREYQKFLDLYPSDPQGPSVRKSLESSYYLAGQEDSLVMEEFLRRFPQSEMAAEGQYRKGLALFEAKNYAQAALELQKAVVSFPGSSVAGDAQLLTAECYAQLKQWEDAARAYQKHLDYFPEHPQRDGAYFNLAIARFNLGDYQHSLEAFQIVVDSFPNSEYAQSAKDNIAACKKRLGAGSTESGTQAPTPEEQLRTKEGGKLR
ncbi:MAG: tetratricopeptide repeat protein [candidate division WOR-3 bacterium]